MTISAGPGVRSSVVEVTNISTFGLWLYVRGREYFLPYENFPWFREKTVGAIVNVVEVHEGHFFWPELDIDLNIDMLENPEKYPLTAK